MANYRAEWVVENKQVPDGLLKALPTFQDPPDDRTVEKQNFDFFKDDLKPPPVAHVDWRESRAVPIPRYQGACNTCGSFASATTIETLHHLKTGVALRLAPTFIHYCLLGRSCNEGGGIRESSTDIIGRGIALGFPGDDPFPTAHCATPHVFKPNKVLTVYGRNNAMNAIAYHGPIVADMYIDPSFLSLPAGAVYSLPPMASNMLHAVCVVGFDQAQQYWIVSNSYGPNWSDNGFGRVAFGSGEIIDSRSAMQYVL